ncbi:hypothetical protein IC611_12970 [Proteus mirabilis]
MMTNITLDNIKLAVQRIAIACEQSQNRLCEADSQLGDGDLGVTMQKGWRQIANDAQDWPDDLSKALFQCSKSLQKPVRLLLVLCKQRLLWQWPNIAKKTTCKK